MADDRIANLIYKLRADHDELSTLLAAHDDGELDDYSTFQCTAEDLLEHAVKIADIVDGIEAG